MASLGPEEAVDDSQVEDRHIVDVDHESPEWRELLNDFNKDNPWDRLCDAIRRGDEITVREGSVALSGTATYQAKIEAISTRGHDFLKLLPKADSSPDDSVIAEACEEKDHDSVRLLLEFGWPINAPVRLLASLLCFFVDDLNFMDELLKAGADVNMRNAVGESAVSMAIAHGTVEVIDLWLQRAADIRHGDLLHQTARRKNQMEGARIAKRLLDMGLDVNAFQYDNPRAFAIKGLSVCGTPLHVACAGGGNVPVARTLLAHGANPRLNALMARKASDTQFDRALATGNEALITVLRDSDRGRSQL